MILACYGVDPLIVPAQTFFDRTFFVRPLGDDPEVSTYASDEDYSSPRDESNYDTSDSTGSISYLNVAVIVGKSILGVGLFAMPYAFSCVGLIFGIIFSIAIGYLIAVALRLLLNVHRFTLRRLKKPTVTYDALVITVLKLADENIDDILLDLAKHVTNLMLIFYYIDNATICVEFIGDVLRNIAMIEETNYPGHYVLILLPPLMLINLTEDLMGMALYSMIGNVLILNVTIIGLLYSLESENSDDWMTLNKDVPRYPRFFGTVFCSLSSPGLILAIEQTTRNLWNYNELSGILNQCMSIIVCIHVIVGIVGYVKWGSNVSHNFIRNIQSEEDRYTLIAFIMGAVAIYFTYGLITYVPINIVSKRYVVPIMERKVRIGTPYAWELMTRFVLTLITCILPKFIPRLRKEIAFIGLTCNFALTVILPLILYTILYVEDNEGIERRRDKKFATLIFCIVLCILFVLSCCILDLSSLL